MLPLLLPSTLIAPAEIIACLDNLHQFPALPKPQPPLPRAAHPGHCIILVSLKLNDRLVLCWTTEGPVPAPTGHSKESLSQG
jgi:hypothetical protein